MLTWRSQPKHSHPAHRKSSYTSYDGKNNYPQFIIIDPDKKLYYFYSDYK